MFLTRKTLFSLLSFLCAQTSFASDTTFVTTLSGDPSWTSAGQTQTLNLAPGVIKTYTANKPSNTISNGDIFFGIQKDLTNELQGQLGLDFAATGGAELTGDIWDDADPTFNNYTYQYKVQHTHIALKGKLLGHWKWPVLPWISATLGAGFNKAYGFTNTPTIFEAIATPNFASRTTTAFTYALGLGIQYSFNKNWQGGLGCEFADWGKSQLGSAGSGSSSGLSLSHLYTSSFLMNITYLA